MKNNKRRINNRIYDTTVTYFEDKIAVYKETFLEIDAKDENAKEECLSRLESCIAVLEAFKDEFTTERRVRKRSDAPTGELVAEQQ